MSLAVWLPLNGSLENQGYMSDYTFSLGSATIDNEGKIGKCYKFTSTSSNGINLATGNANDFFTNVVDNKSFSMCGWLKTSESYSPIIYLSYGIRLTGGASTLIGIDNNTNSVTVNSNVTTNDGKWHHICGTYSSSTRQVKIYVDGINTGTGTLPGSDFVSLWRHGIFIGRNPNNSIASSTYFLVGSLNDVRIYDHALSPLEVKEIAQGLVLHYKLNGNDYGNPNLLANSKLGGSWSYPSSSYSDKYSPLTTIIPSASQYTLSFEAKSTVNGDKIRTHYYSPNTTTTCVSNQGVSKSASDGNMDFTLTTNWKKYWVIYSQNETTAVKHVICPRLVSGQGTGTVSVRNVKLEEGSVATPWCPNSADELYKTLGIDTTTILDSSGYNNNGTINGTLNTSSNTSRYSISTIFNGSDNSIKIPFNDMIKDKNYTISVWTYKTSIGTKNYQTILGGPSGFELEARSNSATDPLYRIHNWGGGITPYEFNKWNLFTFVHTDSNSKLYVNGELKITGSSKDIPIGNYYIGSWNTATSQNYEGQMSDFRIYCTALSATDIQLLYSAGARADNLGSLHVQEFEEGARKGITTQRILYSSNFYESGYLELLHYDKNVYTEPDGTTWVHIFHHNDPTTNGLFASTDNFETSVYKNEHKWYDIEPLMSNMPMYEFLVVQKTTSSATEVKYRWIQNVNPLEATWADVKPGTVAFNTSSGYTNSSYGGLWKMNSNARMCIANGSSGNWYGALGSWTVYQTNQVPGFPNTSISTGYIDLYIRIYIPIKFIKDTGTNALNFIEI